MIVIDTSVLVYAVGDDHRWHEPCARIVAALGDGRLVATTTVEVIQEFVHVRARRRPRASAAALGSDFATLLSPLLPLQIDDLRRGLAIWNGLERIGSFDAVLAAAAMSAGAALVSADRSFSDVDGLVHHFPDAVDIDA